MTNEQITDLDQESENELDILEYVQLFLAKWYWIAISCILCILVALFVIKFAPKRYLSSASIMVVDKEDALGSLSGIMKDMGGMSGFGKSNNIDNQIGIIQSYTSVYNTLKNLNFQISYFEEQLFGNVEVYTESPFYVELDTDYNDYNNPDIYTTENIGVSIISDDEYRLTIERDTCTISRTLYWGEQYQDETYRFKLQKSGKFNIDRIRENNADFLFNILSYNVLTKLYQKNLIVEANSKKGTIINLSIQDATQQKATDFLNGIIATCVDYDLQNKNETSQRSEQFINEQLSLITDSLTFAETNLETFRSNNKIVDLSSEGSALYKKLEEQERQKSQRGIRLNYYNYLLSSLKNNDIIKMPSITGIDDPLLTSLISQLNHLYTEKQVITYSATDNNPNLQIINRKIEQTRISLIDNVNSLIEASKLEMREIKKEIEKTNEDIQQLPSTERELINIQRKFDVNNTVYSFLLQKRAEIGLTRAANVSDIKTIDKARTENTPQSFPKTKTLLALALALGIIIPCGIIYLIHYLDNTISNRSEIEKKTQVPILGGIVHNKHDEKMPMLKKPRSAIAESFRGLRSNLAFVLGKNNGEAKIISFTSTFSGEGKSFCAMNLAASLAMLKKRTLIIGLDLRKPRLTEMMDKPNDRGVTSFLIGQDSFEDVILHSENEYFDIIPAGPIPPNPAELLESDQFSVFINTCKNHGYEYIILDEPPVGLVSDGFTLTKYCDCNIFVIRQKYSSKDSIRLVNSIHREKKMSNMYLLLNDAPTIHGYGYYSKGGHYGYGYGYYGDEKKK